MTTALAFVGGANADKPPPGHAVHFVATDPTGAGIFEPLDLVDPAGNVLPSASCGLSLEEGAGTNLAADVHGWESDPDPNDPRGLRVVWLQAHVVGTVTDPAGNLYHVSGKFVQSGLQTFPGSQVPFDGTGQVKFVGTGGIVRGVAEFRDVAAFPAEWDFFFTTIQLCRPA
ncbi:MAG TPA: hypothetical protein VHS03_05975 [Gaiellaceae bacterium]|nr:hypothetical protein [Gaiellaceae bacterium]